MEKLLKINKSLEFDYSDLMRVVDPNHKFTLRDVLRACINSKIPIEVLKQIIQCDYIEDYWKECNSKKFRNDRGMEYLELSWISEIHHFKGVTDSGHVWSFHGVGKEGVIPQDIINHYPKKEIDKMIKEKYREGYAIEFTPMYKLTGLEIKINNKINVEDWRGIDKTTNKKRFYENMNTELDVQPSITLIEVLYWIFYELSFCGSLENRDTMMSKVLSRVDDYKKAKKEGTLKVVNFDKLKKEPWDV